ncbi:MAG: alpha/beta hydrolase [Myxococcales bacterium FL481]|nr:MAG: alpha/beta hydrolase [Myxococcales bacterium FL481]
MRASSAFSHASSTPTRGGAHCLVRRHRGHHSESPPSSSRTGSGRSRLPAGGPRHAGPGRSVPLLVLVLSCRPEAETVTATAWDTENRLRDQMVGIGNGRYRFRTTPGNSPNVVFIAGGGTDATYWSALQNELTARTGAATVSYDRAGHGESDPAEGEYRLENEANSLRIGLEAINRERDVILVSHSFGAFVAFTYIALFPDDVAYSVFLDPNTVRYVDGIGGAQAQIKSADLDALPNDNFGHAMREILRAYPQLVEDVRSLPKSTPPCQVVSGERRWLPSAHQHEQWLAGHRALAQRCKTPWVLSEHSDHHLAHQAPDLVLDTIVSAVKIATSG